MIFFIWMLAALCLLGVCYAVWQHVELMKFSVTKYEIVSEKIKKEIRLAVLADLHGFNYGPQNQRLIEAVKDCAPSLILIPGDLIVSKYPETYEKAFETLKSLLEIAPVYYSFGNHESRAYLPGIKVRAAFSEYMKQAEKAGAVFLNNENRRVMTTGGFISLGGLEIPLDYYEKGRAVPMEDDYVGSLMGEPDKDCFQVLMAHNPMYSAQYAFWGADVTFCGHNHGGLICLPGIGSLMSPQLTWFPTYNAGDYRIGNKHVIVSRGLGTHTFHVRINNRAELVCLSLMPNGKKGGCQQER